MLEIFFYIFLFVKKRNILCNESTIYLVFTSSYFLRSFKVGGTNKIGSGEDKRCSGLKMLKTKVKRGISN